MTCLQALFAAGVAITASLLGGCSDTLTPAAGGDAAAPAKTAAPAKAEGRTAVEATDTRIGEQFASLALDDRGLSQVRGGFEASSGVMLNFTFQQATFINHNLAQSVVVPTITVSPGSGTAAAAGASSAVGDPPPSVSIPSLAGLGVTGPARGSGGTTVGSTTIVNGGSVQAQVSLPAQVIQSLVNSGVVTVVSSLGGGGLTNVISNTANNQLVQQVITVDIGITGLSKVVQQGVTSTLLNRLVPAASAFR